MSVTAIPDTLALISEARRALTEARTLPDIRRVMEAAQVAADAGRRAAKLAEAQQMAADVVRAAEDAANDAAAIRIEAQARAGEMLRQMAERGERDPGGRGRIESRPATQLDDLGVTKSDSSRWQRVADIPEPVREEYVDRTKAGGDEVTTSGLLRYADGKVGEQQEVLLGQVTDSIDQQAPDAAERIRLAKVAAEYARHMHAVSCLPFLEPQDVLAAVGTTEIRAARLTFNLALRWLEKVEGATSEIRVLQGDDHA
jgi:hypothetical protein